jgi:UDP-N-acetylenolpyruvoylglucosamine reductase
LSIEHGGHPVVLGGGSNVVASDTGCPQPVIHVTTRGVTPESLTLLDVATQAILAARRSRGMVLGPGDPDNRSAHSST